MFSALATVCTVYCAVEIVLITLHYITLTDTFLIIIIYTFLSPIGRNFRGGGSTGHVVIV